LSDVVQAKHVIPYGNSWYDTLNSTINYTLQIEKGSESLSLVCPTCVFYVPETSVVIVGGKGGALSINTDTLDIVELLSGISRNSIVRDIHRVNDDLYLITDRDVYKSTDFGDNWAEYTRSGLSNNLYTLGYIGNNLVVGGEDGVYIKSSLIGDWDKTIDSSFPVRVMLSSNLLFAVINGSIYVSANGYSFVDTGVGPNLDITSMARFGHTNMYVATKQGLYSDNGTFNSSQAQLQDIDLGDLTDDAVVNCVSTDSLTKTVVGMSDGSYAVIEYDTIKPKEYTSLETIHKVLIANDDIWLFGNNLFKVPCLDYPIRLSTGSPL
jgi:hypothetical protein